MLIVTTIEIPGYRVDAVIGQVMGITARTVDLGTGLSAGLRALSGGEVSELTQLLYDSRNQAVDRMWQQCVERGGNAIVRMRFDTSQSPSEVCAYGTAVVVSPIATAEEGGTLQSIGQARFAATSSAANKETVEQPTS